MATSVSKQNEHDTLEQNLQTEIQRDSNVQKRHSFYAIAALLGGVISIALATPLLFEKTLFYQAFAFITGIGWLVMAALYKFSAIESRKLHVASFIIIESQLATTNLLYLLLTQLSLTDFLTSLMSAMFVLVLIIIISFILFSTRIAEKVATVNAILVIGLIFVHGLFFASDARSVVFPQIIEPSIYVAIAIYLARALALFQNDAMSAKTQADHYELLAFYDPLTSVANRRMLVNEMQKEITTAHRYNLPLSVMIFDIDYFKKVNDTYGHNFGDEVLKSVASNVKARVRASDSFGRWGGEEFLCVMPNTSATLAFELAERLRLGIESLTFENGSRITASFGIAQLMDSDNFDSLVNRADKALYTAKENGRNCCEPVPSSTKKSFESLSVEPSFEQSQHLS